MAKKKVKFKVTDGMKPRKLNTPGKPFGLRIPLPLNLAPRSNQTVRLGVTCDVPVFVVGRLETKLFSPGQELSVNLSAGTDPVNYGPGEVVAQVFVLDNSDLEVEE